MHIKCNVTQPTGPVTKREPRVDYFPGLLLKGVLAVSLGHREGFATRATAVLPHAEAQPGRGKAQAQGVHGRLKATGPRALG